MNSVIPDNHTTVPKFLSGGGEMGQRIRQYNWSHTSIGPFDQWPQSLCTAVGMMLHSKFPMFLFWGPEALCFYNDAYRPILCKEGDGKHPCLGKKGKDVWPEVWHLIGPQLEQVMNGGEATWHKDQLVSIFRNGKMEDVYCTYSFSPVFNEAGSVAGVFVVCTETTGQVQSHQKLEVAEEEMRLAIESSEMGYWNINPLTGTFSCNEKTRELFGLAPAGDIDLTVGIQSIHPHDRALVSGALQAAMRYENSGRYHCEYRTAHPADGTMRYVSATGQAYKNEAGQVYRFSGTVMEITEEKKAEKVLMESEQKFRHLIQSNIVGVLFWDIEGGILDANDTLLQLLGYTRADLEKGLDWQAITPPQWAEKDRWGVAQVLAHGSHPPYEKQYFHKNGQPVDIILGSTAFGGTDNRRGVTFVVDISERKKTEEALKESKERLQAALDASLTGTFRWNIQTNELFWDENLDRLFGLPPGKTVRNLQNFIERVHPEEQQQVIDRCRRCAEEGADFDMEFRVVWPDGSLHWLDDKGKTYFDENGKPLYMTGACVDISEHKEANVALQQSEERFRQMADLIPQIVWTANSDGYIDYYNRRWYTYTGFTKEKFGDISWQPVLHPSEVETVAKVWYNSVKTGEPYQLELRLLDHATKQYRWFLAKALPVREKNGSIIKWFGSTTDIHDQKTLAEQLERLVAERTAALQRSNEDLLQFAHVASHDLKEPVRKVRLFSTRLGDEFKNELPEKAKSYLSKIDGAADRMYAMIDGVLLYSSLQVVEPVMEPIDLNMVLRDIQADLELIVAQKQAVFNVRSLPTILGMGFLIYQLFYNLVNNSLKFAKAGVPPVITVSSNESKAGGAAAGFVDITLTDNGIGFDQNDAEKIFVTFMRLNAKDKYEGTGLGLSLCKKIVERHGGTIRAKSEMGQGATFTVTLPAGPIHKKTNPNA